MKILSSIVYIIVVINITNYCWGQNTLDCNLYKKWGDSYEIFNSPIPAESRTFLVEITGDKKEELILYGKYINNLIVKKKIEKLLVHISKTNFVMYIPGGNDKNIVKLLRTQFKEKKGDYFNIIFDVMKIWAGLKGFQPKDDQKLDIRKYLICFKDKLKWRVYYNSKLKVYVIDLSIHDWAIEHLQHFSYVVKERNGKFILVGF